MSNNRYQFATCALFTLYVHVCVIQEQYHFLHMALIESLMLSSSALPSSNFLQAYDELLSFDEKARCLGIKRDFEVFALIPQYAWMYIMQVVHNFVTYYYSLSCLNGHLTNNKFLTNSVCAKCRQWRTRVSMWVPRLCAIETKTDTRMFYQVGIGDLKVLSIRNR